MIRALNDSDSHVRYRAARALGKIGDPLAVAPLILALNDSDNRSAAAEALIDIGEPAVAHLILALNDSDRSIRKVAAAALGEIGDPQAIDPLITALNDSDNDVRGGLQLR